MAVVVVGVPRAERDEAKGEGRVRSSSMVECDGAPIGHGVGFSGRERSCEKGGDRRSEREERGSRKQIGGREGEQKERMCVCLGARIGSERRWWRQTRVPEEREKKGVEREIGWCLGVEGVGEIRRSHKERERERETDRGGGCSGRRDDGKGVVEEELRRREEPRRVRDRMRGRGAATVEGELQRRSCGGRGGHGEREEIGEGELRRGRGYGKESEAAEEREGGEREWGQLEGRRKGEKEKKREKGKRK